MFAVKADKNSNDTRIILARISTAIGLVISLYGIITAEIATDDQVFLTMMVSVLALLMMGGFTILRRNKSAALIFVLLSIYIWVAYPIKLILLIHDPMASWVSHHFFHPRVVQKEISGAFYTIFPGIIALCVGFMTGRNNLPDEKEGSAYVLRHHYFVSIIVFLMLIKILVQTFLDIGLPGVRPPTLPIPFLAGILDMLTRPVLFAVVNLYFYCVLRFRERRGLLIAVGLLLVNIGLSVRVGWKSELVLQGVFVFYYIFDLYKFLPKRRRKFVTVISIIILIATINLYTFINDYRNYIISGKTMSEAMDKAEKNDEKTASSFSLSPIFDRINGIGEYYAATKLGAGKNFPLDSLLNDRVMNLILEKLYGPEKHQAVTAFGTTQFSVLYLIGGVPFVTIGCFIFGWAFRWISVSIKRHLLSAIAFNAYLPMMGILWIKVLSAGGMLPLYLKELALVVSCLFIVERVCYTERKTVEQENWVIPHQAPTLE